MPSDFLLPAFVATLVANAVLIAVAIRGLRRGHATDERTHIAAAAPRTGPAPAVPAQAARPPADAVAGDPIAAPTAETPALRKKAAKRSAGASSSRAPVATPRRKPRAPTPPPSVATSMEQRPADEPAPAKRRRRKFALPPLDDDHEKVRRSIETFLTGTPPLTPVDAESPVPATAVGPSAPAENGAAPARTIPPAPVPASGQDGEADPDEDITDRRSEPIDFPRKIDRRAG